MMYFNSWRGVVDFGSAGISNGLPINEKQVQKMTNNFLSNFGSESRSKSVSSRQVIEEISRQLIQEYGDNQATKLGIMLGVLKVTSARERFERILQEINHCLGLEL